MAIDTVQALGDDVLSNMWEIIIPEFPGAIDTQSTIIRTTKVEIPDYEVDTYPIEYKTQTFTKPKAKNKTPNQFTFDFRVDKYWKTYEGFENWKQIILSDDTGAMASDGLPGTPSLIRIPIDVIPIDSNGTQIKKGWTFTGCWLSNLKGFTFNMDGTPIEVAVTMQFIKKLMRS